MTQSRPLSTAYSQANNARPRWFSLNPDKAWGEKFFLLYIPYFFALNAMKASFGWLNVGTFWHITQNMALLAPLVLLPLVLGRYRAFGLRWYQSYSFKMVVWIFIFNLTATYFLTEYFFDVLGMVYHFPEVTLSLDSALLGSGELVVPLGMYLNAPAFFVVYHTLAVVIMRRVRTLPMPLSIKPLITVVAVICIAYGMAFLETRLIANDANSESFYYKDLAFMLKYGSMFYACYFFASFPMVYRLDEAEGERWPLSRVVIDALAAGMIAFFLVDLATHWLTYIGLR